MRGRFPSASTGEFADLALRQSEKAWIIHNLPSSRSYSGWTAWLPRGSPGCSPSKTPFCAVPVPRSSHPGGGAQPGRMWMNMPSSSRRSSASWARSTGEIHRRRMDPGPVHLPFPVRSDLVAYYRTCEIALITPLKDGMDFIARNTAPATSRKGVLILSEFAGAASQLHISALMVNPYEQGQDRRRHPCDLCHEP